MASTVAGRELTEAHRRRQLVLRAATLRQVLSLWPMFRIGDIDGTWPPLEAALVVLIGARRRDSAGTAADYYRAFRVAEGASGRATPRLAPPPPAAQVVASLRLLGPILTKKALAARRPNAAENALVRVSGSVARHTLNAGRETLLASVQADPEATGWRRVTDGDPCPFCASLAGRTVSKTARAAAFPAHDHCGCTAEPQF